MKPAVIDPKNTTRAAAFELWMDAPNPMVTFFKTLDVTPLVCLSRRRGLYISGAVVRRCQRGRDLRHARPDRPLHSPLPPLLPLGITQTPPPAPPAGVPCVYPRKFQKDFSKKLLRGEGTAEDAARRIQSRASLYMTEQYG